MAEKQSEQQLEALTEATERDRVAARRRDPVDEARENDDTTESVEGEAPDANNASTKPPGDGGDRHPIGLSNTGKVLVGVGIALWLGFFLGGIVVDTRPFRKAISEPGLTAAIGKAKAKKVVAYQGPLPVSVAVAYFFFTPTNLAILTLLAGLLGTLGRKASLSSDPKDSAEADRINPKLSAFLRSYLVFLFFLSGVLVFADEPFSAPSPSSYLRLAGVMSLFSFVANYRPSFFARMLEDVHKFVDSKSPKAAPGGSS